MLQEGDRIGLMRKSSGDLHFYVNGLDQGVAATRVPAQIWGAVDVYGMTVRVSSAIYNLTWEMFHAEKFEQKKLKCSKTFGKINKNSEAKINFKDYF